MVVADPFEKQAECPLQFRVVQPHVADEHPQGRPVLLLYVRVVVLAPRPRPAEARLWPMPRHVFVDDGVDQFRAAVRMHAPNREGHRLQIPLEGGLVVRGAEVEAGTGLEPTRPAVRGRGRPEEVPFGNPAAEGDAVDLHVAGVGLPDRHVLPVFAGDFGENAAIAPRPAVPPTPDLCRARTTLENALHGRRAHGRHAGRHVGLDVLQLAKVLEPSVYVRLQVLGAQATRSLPDLHQKLFLLGPVRLPASGMDAVAPRPSQKPDDVLAAQVCHTAYLVEHPASTTTVGFPDIVLLLAQDVFLDGLSAHGVHASMILGVRYLTKALTRDVAPFLVRCPLL